MANHWDWHTQKGPMAKPRFCVLGPRGRVGTYLEPIYRDTNTTRSPGASSGSSAAQRHRTRHQQSDELVSHGHVVHQGQWRGKQAPIRDAAPPGSVVRVVNHRHLPHKGAARDSAAKHIDAAAAGLDHSLGRARTTEMGRRRMLRGCDRLRGAAHADTLGCLPLPFELANGCVLLPLPSACTAWQPSSLVPDDADYRMSPPWHTSPDRTVGEFNYRRRFLQLQLKPPASPASPPPRGQQGPKPSEPSPPGVPIGGSRAAIARLGGISSWDVDQAACGRASVRNGVAA